MPNIRELNPGAIDIRPTEVGIEATAAAARRGGAFFNQASQAVDTLGQRVGGAIRDAGDAYVRYRDHQEISAGAANGSTLIANYNQDWNDAAKDALKNNPGDPSVAAKWREEKLEPALQKFQESFTTENSQRWAQHFVDQYREHMTLKTAADMSSFAAEAIHQHVRTTQNSLGNAVYNDPSSLGLARDTFSHSLDGMIGSSPNLTATAAGKVKNDLTFETEQHLVRAAVMGAIAKGGDWQRIADDPKNTQYINQAEMEQFVRADRYYKRSEQAAARAETAQADHEAKTKFNDEINKLELSTTDENGNPVVGPQHFQQLNKIVESNQRGASLEPGRVAAMLRNLETVRDRMDKPEPLASVSHKTTMQLLGDIREGRMTTEEPIYDGYRQGGLNRADFNFLRTEYEQRKTSSGDTLGRERTEFFKRYAPVIDAGFSQGIHSSAGTQQMYFAEMAARQQERELIRASKDPHLVYDPRSEYFFGKPENLGKYQVSLQDARKELKTPGTMPILSAPQPRASSQAEVDKLPKGAEFIWSDGKRYRKN